MTHDRGYSVHSGYKSSDDLRPYRNIFEFIDVAAITIILALFLIGVYLISAYNPHVWVDLIVDDAYYYLGIARNITLGLGSSFMPPFHTNGYQPLWMLILVLTSKIFGISDRSLVLQIYCLSFLFVLFFAFLSKKYYRYSFPAIVLSITYPMISLYGMETTLLPSLVILFFSSRNPVERGIWSSLLFLARLDALALVIARDIYIYIMGRKNNFNHYLILVPVVIFYCLTNYYFFDLFVPVSGLAKSMGNIRGENIYPFLQYLSAGLQQFVFFIPIACIILLGKGSYFVRYKDEIASLLLALLICSIYYSVNSGWMIWDWYFWPVFMLTFYFCAETINFFFFNLSRDCAEKDKEVLDQPGKILAVPNDFAIGFCKKWLDQIINNNVLLLIIVVTFACIFFPAYRLFAVRSNLIFKPDNNYLSWGKRNIELVDFIKEGNISKNTFFAMGDRAGSFGFFLGPDFKFLQTEGLVASTDYYWSMADDNALNYINTLSIDYFIVDRERYLQQNNIIGIVEPVQALSSHFGEWLICFKQSDILWDQSYYNEKRYIFNFKNRIQCPENMAKQYLGLRSTYGGVRKFSFPRIYNKGPLQRFFNLQVKNIPPY